MDKCEICSTGSEMRKNVSMIKWHFYKWVCTKTESHKTVAKHEKFVLLPHIKMCADMP